MAGFGLLVAALPLAATDALLEPASAIEASAWGMAAVDVL